MKIPVYKIDKEDNVIERYESISEAAKANQAYPSCIHRAIKRQGATNGYKWEYATKETEDETSIL